MVHRNDRLYYLLLLGADPAEVHKVEPKQRDVRAKNLADAALAASAAAADASAAAPTPTAEVGAAAASTAPSTDAATDEEHPSKLAKVKEFAEKAAPPGH